MKLFLNSYVEEVLKKARYEYCEETKSWCAISDILPGAYAQADTLEEARNQLAEVIEEYVLVSLANGDDLPVMDNLDFSFVFKKQKISTLQNV